MHRRERRDGQMVGVLDSGLRVRVQPGVCVDSGEFNAGGNRVRGSTIPSMGSGEGEIETLL